MPQLNESVLKMTLNADNRDKFKKVILDDAFMGRSDALRKRYYELVDKLVARTWGKTSQAQAANRKAADKLRAMSKALEDKGVKTILGVGTERSCLKVNAAGRNVNVNIRLDNDINSYNVFNFYRHALNTTYRNLDNSVHCGSDSVTLTASDPLNKEFDSIKDVSDELSEAAEELKAVLNTVFGKSRTLRAAIEKWPGLEVYVPLILSSCREIVVAGPVIDKRLAALRDGKLSVKEAMKLK